MGKVQFALNPSPSPFKYDRKVILALGVFAFFMIFLPFRHLLIPGNVHWTEEGHKYAWHMKLRGKSGITRFLVRDKNSGETIEVNTDGYLDDWQADKMDGNTIMIWKFAKFLKKEFQQMGSEVEVYANARASLNGRRNQVIIDPNVDLASQKKPLFGHARWILPLTVPLSDQQ